MRMSESEIVKDYMTAKFKYKQIGILADLNLKKRADIIDVLQRAGVYVPPKNTKTKGNESNGGGHRKK